MPAPYYYYVFPFGESADDLTTIPTNPAGDGSVSYFYGWTDPYEYDLATNPAALPIPRGQMNQLLFDITNNLQEYQQYGSPQWVVGNTVSYPIYARVYYSGQVYESQIANNTNTPGTDTTWTQISAGAQGVQPGSVIEFAGVNIPSGYLLCNGAAVARASYVALYNAITQTQNGVTTNTMTGVTGLTDTSQMYVGEKIEGMGIQAGTTIAAIPSSTSITMSLPATASATVAITFFNWGNGDGSTTFNVPDLRRRVPMGSGGTGTTTIGNVVGQIGGEENHALTANENGTHSHGAAGTPTGGTPSFVVDHSVGTVSIGSGGSTTSQQTLTANSGLGQGHNTIQPSVIFNSIIKY